MKHLWNVRTLMVLMAVLMAVGSVNAQTTTGRLLGTVVDDQGAPLPGVTVTIDSPALIGGPKVTISDTSGEFSFIGLAPGKYTVKTDLSGFIPQELGDIEVALGGARTIVVEMPQGTFTGQIEVVSETPVVDPTQVNTSVNYTDTYMQGSAIGSANRSYQTVLQQTAGVAGGSNPNVLGSTLGENAYYVDGANTTDPVTATFGTNFTFDSIQEIQFQTSGFEAEYGSATGGIVNLVTKSGGNNFSGTADIRYQDDSFQESGDHYDASELSSKREEVDLTLGGPILRDKLWFFVAYQYVKSDRTPIGAPVTRSFIGNYPIAKLTLQAGQSWRVTGKYTSDPADIDNTNASSSRTAEATRFQTQGADIYSAEVNGVLTDALLWDTVLSSYRSTLDSYPQTGDLESIGHYSYDTGIYSVNYMNQQYSNRNRDDITTALTYFVDDLAGSHEFKAGLVYADLNFKSTNCDTGVPGGLECNRDVPGNRLFDRTTGDGTTLPYLWWQDYTAGELDYNGTNNTLYVQDTWRVVPNLTLKVGVRYDVAKYDTNDATSIADMKKWQPRVGFAYDITGDAKNIVRGNWGYFMSPNALTLPSFARTAETPSNRWYSCSSIYGMTAEECQQLAADRGATWSQGPPGEEDFDPNGWILNLYEMYGSVPNQIDPNLKAMYTETWSVAYERAVGKRAALTFTYVDKQTNDIFEDTCDGNVPTPNADASCDYYLMANLDALTRDYTGFIVEYSTRSFDWLTLNASYTYSKSRGSQEYDQNAGIDFDFYPAHFENRYGYLSDHRLGRFKLNGFFSIKGDWTIAFDGYYDSAFTWEPQANSAWSEEEVPYNGQIYVAPYIPYGTWYVLPRGSEEANSNYQLDLQVSKGFTIGNQVRLVLIASAFNVFSSETVTDVCDSVSGCTDVNGTAVDVGGPTDWQTPRRYEVGFRVEF